MTPNVISRAQMCHLADFNEGTYKTIQARNQSPLSPDSEYRTPVDALHLSLFGSFKAEPDGEAVGNDRAAAIVRAVAPLINKNWGRLIRAATTVGEREELLTGRATLPVVDRAGKFFPQNPLPVFGTLAEIDAATHGLIRRMTVVNVTACMDVLIKRAASAGIKLPPEFSPVTAPESLPE